MILQDITPVPISQYDNEFWSLLSIYKVKKPKNVLEIGTHYGGTLYHWIRCAPKNCKISAIDDQHINRNIYNTWRHDVNIDYYLGDSHTKEAYEWAKLPDQYDFIFIDGDHSYEGVKDDWARYKSLIGPKGIIAFHDIGPHPERGVDKLWNEIKNDYDTFEIIDPKYKWPDICGIGVVFYD